MTIDKPEDVNLILGQAHFIKTVEDLHEALAGAVPNISFGLAFCESSGPCLVRWSGTDQTLTDLARDQAHKIGAGHSFIIFLKLPRTAFRSMSCRPSVRFLKSVASTVQQPTLWT